jgi:hypothetical protein
MMSQTKRGRKTREVYTEDGPKTFRINGDLYTFSSPVQFRG